MKRPSTGITSLDILCAALTGLLVFRLISRLSRRIPEGLRLPPGPPGKWIIGNVTDWPTKTPVWEAFDRWAKQYGELVHIKLLGTSIIIVNSLDIAHELFEKRSAIYSDHTDFPMAVELMEWDWNIATMHYGGQWRRHRRMFHQHFHADAVVAHQDVQTRQTRFFLQELHKTPEDFISHIRHLAGSIIVETVYGIKLLPKGDPYVEIAEAVVAVASEAAVPGRYLVDIFPSLKHIPEWMPGAGFQQTARKWRPYYRKMADMPFESTKDSLNAGTARPSILATLLEELSSKTSASADEEWMARNVAAMAYAAGSDTTVSTLATFVLAMVLYPKVQQKAQAELDTVIGDRLPVLDDRSNLPYVTALCKEVHRWHPVFPLGIGHRVMQDDIYEGYFIPAGSLVIGSAWTLLRNEKIYGPNPNDFDPDRFLKPRVFDPIGHFGFGRRICPGRYMAENSVFIAIASMLKVFDISHKTDSDGNKILVEPIYNLGLVTHPEPFECKIMPRSELAETLILGMVDE